MLSQPSNVNPPLFLKRWLQKQNTLLNVFDEEYVDDSNHNQISLQRSPWETKHEVFVDRSVQIHHPNDAMHKGTTSVRCMREKDTILFQQHLS